MVDLWRYFRKLPKIDCDDGFEDIWRLYYCGHFESFRYMCMYGVSLGSDLQTRTCLVFPNNSCIFMSSPRTQPPRQSTTGTLKNTPTWFHHIFDMLRCKIDSVHQLSNIYKLNHRTCTYNTTSSKKMKTPSSPFTMESNIIRVYTM